jgi:hypothetical protein
MTIYKPTSLNEDDTSVTLNYMDLNDFECELGVASGGNLVFCSPEEVLSYRKCASACGLVEVEFTSDRPENKI